MIGLLCIGMPAFIWLALRNKLLKMDYSFQRDNKLYFVSLLGINFLMLCILVIGFKNTGNLFYNLNNYNLFALKYLSLALAIAIGSALLEWCVREKNIKVIFAEKKLNENKWRIIAIIYALILAGFNFIRIFDNLFWEDEAFTIGLLPLSFSEIINMTAADVHPPLYYLITRIICEIFGYSGPIYHLASFIPYIIVVILGLTVIWKWFGKETSLLFITMASMLNSSLRYNVEVRMYAWGAVFVLISFLAMYGILKNNKKVDWIIFVLASLAAAYTHYYCLISVAFFYVVLILDAMFRNRSNAWRIILTCVVTVAAYLPWLFILLQTLKRTSDNYWIASQPTFKECMLFLFDSKNDLLFIWVFIISTVFLIVKEFSIFKLEYKDTKEKALVIDLSKKKVTNEFVWILAGISALIGTTIVGIGISVLLRPMFIVRYLYPVSVVAWLLLGVCISRCKFKMVFAVALSVIVLHGGFAQWQTWYASDTYRDDIQSKTLALTVKEITEEDYILTNSPQINWTIANIYYPGVYHEMVNLDELPELDKEKEYWFVLNEKPEDVFFDNLKEKGFVGNLVVEQGYLGAIDVWIYQVVAK